MSAPDVPGFDPAPKAPARRAPDRACDCHMHVFGPAAKYPWSAARGYTPPEALLRDYARLQERLGLERTVVVQPSVYGTDNACTRDAVLALGADGRGIAVLPAEVEEATLRSLDADGFCGSRFNLVSKGGESFDGIERLARKLAPLGWHLQFFIDRDTLFENAGRLARLPVEVVIDHFGSADPDRNADQPAMRALLRLLDGGRAWVKISGCYRVDHGSAPWPAAAPFAERLLGEAPERVVWGTDWPHPMVDGPMPNDGDLLDALWAWCGGDERLYRRVLVENPARLYGFA
jgi:predicted TIM-barrel fold metal-dependent hydrolase